MSNRSQIEQPHEWKFEWKVFFLFFVFRLIGSVLVKGWHMDRKLWQMSDSFFSQFFRGRWQFLGHHRCRPSQQRIGLLDACQERWVIETINSGLICCDSKTQQCGYLSSWTRWAVMRVPEAPSGCPIAMAPPFTLLFSGSSPSALATARYWGANASFT